MDDPRVSDDTKKEVGWGTFWWTVAAVFHGAALFGLIYFTPLREWFFGREEADAFAEVEGPRVRNIVRTLLDVHTKRLRQKVEDQKRVLADLAFIRDKRYERYVAQAEGARRKGEDVPAPEPMATLGPAGPDANLPLDGRGIGELYEIAQAIEQTTYGTYRQMRAVELARIQSLSLKEAAEATKVALPTHPDLDERVLEEDIWNTKDGKLDALKTELLKVRAEVGSMVAAALRMLDMAEGLMASDVGGYTFLATGGGALYEGSGDTRWGSAIGPPLLAHEYFPGAKESRFGEDFRPVPGRKLMKEGRQAEWMYVDTWYTIGPFPNPDRAHLDKKFPPESVVDLDATYIGKQGRRLRWEFKQWPAVMIAPIVVDKYAIWYAYTEIYAEKDMDRWVAFGSDDYSKAWLNGELIWTSGKTPHHWIPDRGFRKLHFRQGYNPLLVKWENAGGTTGFSVVINLAEPPG